MTAAGLASVNQAVDCLFSTLPDEQLDTIRDTLHDELITLHFSVGMYIRNEVGLWRGNDDLLASCLPDVTDPYMLAIAKHDPDRASGVIVEALWERLQVHE